MLEAKLAARIKGRVCQGTNVTFIKCQGARVYARMDGRYTVCWKGTKLVLSFGETICWFGGE